MGACACTGACRNGGICPSSTNYERGFGKTPFLSDPYQWEKNIQESMRHYLPRINPYVINNNLYVDKFPKERLLNQSNKNDEKHSK